MNDIIFKSIMWALVKLGICEEIELLDNDNGVSRIFKAYARKER